MRINIRQLKSAGRRQWLYALFVLAGVSAAVLLWRDLNVRKSELGRLTKEVEALEARTAAFRLPGPEELRRRKDEEAAFAAALQGNETAPLLYAEITRIGSETSIQGIAINTEEKRFSAAAADSAAEPSEEARLAALGISGYSALTIQFQGSYANVAGFIDAMSRLPYAASIRSVDLRRTVPLIDGTLVLHVYQRGPA
jgi:hypothetical protein